MIGDLAPDGAAKRDGLEEGDVLLSAGGVAFVGDVMEVLDAYLGSGDPITFVVRRGGEEVEVTVKPDPRWWSGRSAVSSLRPARAWP
ncbi:MAG: hypothetical protein ACE5GX_15800 [Thermoanaerobaculia bacterium]